MAEPGSAATVVLVHGLWMTPRSWERWIPHYEASGYRVLAPAYPGLEVEVEALGVSAHWTMTAAARQFHETRAIEQMIENSPAARDAWVRVNAPDGSVIFEGILAPGDTYTAPTVHAVWGDGLNAASAGFHAEVLAHLSFAHARRNREAWPGEAYEAFFSIA